MTADCFSLFVVSPPLKAGEEGTPESSRFIVDLPYQMRFDVGRLTEESGKYECAVIDGALSRSWFNVQEGEFWIRNKSEEEDRWTPYKIPSDIYDGIKGVCRAIKSESGGRADPEVNSTEEWVTISVETGYVLKFGYSLSRMFLGGSREFSDSFSLPIDPYWDFKNIFVEGPGWINGSVVNESERPVVVSTGRPWKPYKNTASFADIKPDTLIFREIEIPETRRLIIEFKDEKGRPLRFFRRSCFLHFLIRKKQIK
jgi:hypothetical protein